MIQVPSIEPQEHPHNPIGQLHALLKSQLENHLFTSLAFRLGYVNARTIQNHLEQHGLDHPLLELDKGLFDLNYGTLGLFEAQHQLLGLLQSLVEALFSDVEHGINFYNQNTSYLFVKTSFSIHHNNLSIFALTAMESRRRIKIEYADSGADLEQMREAQVQIIRRLCV
jgi:hypothetical protein